LTLHSGPVSRFLYLYAGMTVVAALLATFTGCPSLFALPVTTELLVSSLVVATVLSMVVVHGGKLLERLDWYKTMATFLKRMMTDPDLLGPTLDSQKAFVIAVYSSIGEEALFRGFLQPWLIGKIGEATGAPGTVPVLALGVVAASLVFGAMHFPVVKELRPWTVFAIVAGLIFGGLAAWSGSLAAPVLAHLLINWLNLRRLAEMPSGNGEPTLP
jgi:membrane protease YdiL (CAAX protease family)